MFEEVVGCINGIFVEVCGNEVPADNDLLLQLDSLDLMLITQKIELALKIVITEEKISSMTKSQFVSCVVELYKKTYPAER